MNDYYGVDPLVAEQYIASLEKHIGFVQEAGKKIGVNLIQLKEHDLSKWSEEEFSAYANKFYGMPDDMAFKYAWLNHLRLNKHHWDHWLLRGRDGNPEPLEMPKHYALEMVADWMGASMAYTGSYDMTGWLESNFPRIILHPNTRQYVSGVLVSLGYTYGLLNGHTLIES